MWLYISLHRKKLGRSLYNIVQGIFSMCIFSSFHFLIYAYLYGLNILNQKTNKYEEPKKKKKKYDLSICDGHKFFTHTTVLESASSGMLPSEYESG